MLDVNYNCSISLSQLRRNSCISKQQIRLWNDYDERIFWNRYTMDMASVDNRHIFDTFAMRSKSMIFPHQQCDEIHMQNEKKKNDGINFYNVEETTQKKEKIATTLA